MLVTRIGSVIRTVFLSTLEQDNILAYGAPCHLAFDIADDRRSEQAQSWQTTELLSALYLIGRRIV